jgi:hypothetical protein
MGIANSGESWTKVDSGSGASWSFGQLKPRLDATAHLYPTSHGDHIRITSEQVREQER